MRTENIKVTITIPIPYDQPDKNGNIYTEEAVEKAISNLHKNMPIIFRDESERKVIGTTTDNSHIATWDFENQVCNLTVNGEVFFGGTESECTFDRDKGKIVDFEIVGIGLSK